MKRHMTYRLAYVYLTLFNFKGQGGGHAHFDVNISQMVRYSACITIARKYEVARDIYLFFFNLFIFAHQVTVVYINTDRILY